MFLFSVFQSKLLELCRKGFCVQFFFKAVITAFCLSRKIFECFSQLVKLYACFFMDCEKIIYRNFFQKIPQKLGKKFPEFRQQNCSNVVRTSFYLSRETFLGNLIINSKNYNISKVSVSCENCDSTFASKLHLMCPEDYLDEKIFFTKYWNSKLFVGLWAEKFQLPRKKPRQGCEKCIERVQRNIKGNCFRRIVFVSSLLSDLSKIFSNLPRDILGKVVITAFFVSRKLREVKFF